MLRRCPGLCGVEGPLPLVEVQRAVTRDGALEQRDYTMLQGLMVIYAFFIVLTNLLTDLAYGLSDPRVKYQ